MADRAVPILPSRDLQETLAFYEQLGFANRGAPPDEWDYLILGRGGAELHFVATPDVDPRSTAGMCFLFVDDADAVFAEWQASGAVPPDRSEPRLQPPMDTEYGMREMALVDPSGNLVRVGSPVAPTA